MKPWFERDAARYEEASQFWQARGFRRRLRDDLLTFSGPVTVRLGSRGTASREHSFEVRITYPRSTPYEPPSAVVTAPASAVVPGDRHRAPRGGELCLFPRSAWSADVPASEVLAAVRRWLRGHITGSFPRELALYELPEYFHLAPLVMIAPAGLLNRSGRHGSFEATEIVGQDIAVIRSATGGSLGHDLLPSFRLGPEVRQESLTGEWYRLDREPPPIHHLQELLPLIGNGGPRTPRKRDLVALLFRDSVLKEERILVLDLGLEGKERPRLARWAVKATRTYTVSEQELFRRLTGLYPPRALPEAHALLLGVGAVGSHAAAGLAREGVGEMTFIDPDFLRPGNVTRHALDLLDVAQLKATAMEVAVGRVNPFAKTRSHVDNTTNPTILHSRMGDADLVVSAIGDDTIEQLVTEVATRAPGKRVIMARTLHAGDAARITLLRPGTDACMFCLDLYRQEGDRRFISVPASPLSEVYDEGCATPSLPGSGLASQLAGTYLAQLAAQVLSGRDPVHNHWIHVFHPIPEADERLLVAPAVYPETFAPRRDCPISCSDLHPG